jgi:hypothetical protein
MARPEGNAIDNARRVRRQRVYLDSKGGLDDSISDG